jgi:hypothetical protein
MKLKEEKPVKPRHNKCVRFSTEELGIIMCKAGMYCEGNVSQWIRYAALNCMPAKEDLVDEEELILKKAQQIKKKRARKIKRTWEK